MKILLERYIREKGDQDILTSVEIIVWDKGSDLLCCTKGTYVFLEQSNENAMFEQLCILLERVI